MPLFLFPCTQVTSLGLRHALCIVCKNKTFSTNLFLYKFLWHKQQICCFKKIYKYPFLLYKYLQYPLPLYNFNCTRSASSFSLAPSPPPDLQRICIYTFALKPAEEEGPSSGGVRAGWGWWWVEVMRVAPLRVWGRWAAFIVLFCWQVLAPGCGRWWHRLWVIVQVTGVPLGCCHWGNSPAGSIVTVTDICAARGCRGCKVPVTVRPIAGMGRK